MYRPDEIGGDYHIYRFREGHFSHYEKKEGRRSCSLDLSNYMGERPGRLFPNMVEIGYQEQGTGRKYKITLELFNVNTVFE
jgi:hypothetical protein